MRPTGSGLPRRLISSALAAMVLTAALLPAAGSAQASHSANLSFAVDSSTDQPDASVGDGVCRTRAAKCTLRAAVMEANAHGGTHTITLPAGTYTLKSARDPGETNSSPAGTAAAKGDLDIGGTLTIAGAGRDSTVIDAGGSSTKDRAFDVRAGGSLALRNLTLRNASLVADESGGGLRNFGKATVQNVAFRNNSAIGGNGGAIRHSGTDLTVSNSLFSDNWADEGGAIRATKSFRAAGTDFARNWAGYNPDGSYRTYGYGGAIDLDDGATLTLDGGSIRDNRSSQKGGGIDVEGAVVFETTPSFSGNTARGLPNNCDPTTACPTP